MKINNLTEEQKREISQLSCNSEPGFEGKQTYPACEVCIVCLCRKSTKYNVIFDRFEGDLK